jgi:hypothetical protein
MGVLPCHRIDCDSIMCNTYVHSVGYVCQSCQNEFKDYLESNRIDTPTEGEIERELIKFMATSKNRFSVGDEMTVEQFFEKHTR